MQWRDVPGYEGKYQVSDTGQVRRVGGGGGSVDGRILRQTPHKQGYLVVNLWKNNNGRMVLAHRVVASAFHGPVDGREVNHLNGIKTDNRAENLEVVDRQANIDHAVATGLIRNKGQGNAQAKLTDDKVREIRARHAAREGGYTKLSREYGVCPGAIRDIIKGRSWAHV